MNWKYPFPEKLDDWRFDLQVSRERLNAVQHSWEFLQPFFALWGYIMYQKSPTSDDLIPRPVPSVTKDATYPYARQVPSNKAPRMGWGVSEELSPKNICNSFLLQSHCLYGVLVTPLEGTLSLS